MEGSEGATWVLHTAVACSQLLWEGSEFLYCNVNCVCDT